MKAYGVPPILGGDVLGCSPHITCDVFQDGSGLLQPEASDAETSGASFFKN